jgi:2-(1,2-epoxy-1,2-dihydrophenyl)acetyl-CoA isomerase
MRAQAGIEGRWAGFTVETHEPGIVWVRFDRPEAFNGFTLPMKLDLLQLTRTLQVSPDYRVLVVIGEKHFSAGDDVRNFYGDEHWEHARSARIGQARRTDELGLYGRLRTFSQSLTMSLRDLDMLSICGIEGHCIQSGFSFALAADFRIAATSARMTSNTLRYGFMPDEGGHKLLVQHLGVAGTMDFLMRRRTIDGGQAVAMGLAHEVVEPADLASRTLALAQELAEGPQVAMRLLKRAIYSADELTMEQALDDIATKTAISDFHPDTSEGVTAWREKRKPRFNTRSRLSESHGYQPGVSGNVSEPHG